MNFDSYKASNLNVASPRDNQDKFTILNDGANALIKENANLGKTIMAGANMLIQQNENVKAIDANNYYNKLVSDGMMKIQSKKEGEALNSVEDFKTMEQKAYEETRRKYGKYLYGRTGSIFEQARSKDANARRQQVEKYQMEQKEKYDDTTLTNSMMQSYTEMGNNINDEKTLENGFAKINQMIAGRYSANGIERIKAEQRNWTNKIVMGLAKSAMDSNDYAAANRILNTYGSELTPDQRGPLAKLIGNQMKLDQQILDNDDLYKLHKGDFGAYMDAVRKNIANYGGNMNKVVDIAVSMIGKNPKDYAGRTLGVVNTCTLLVREALRKGGMDAGKDGDDWAPTMLKHLEEEKRTFKDAGQLRHGDIVFWETNNNWDDGTDHVGIYDATTNTVIQSGTSGIKRINLNDYQIHSFAHPRGSEKSISPSERVQIEKRAAARYKELEAEENAISDEKYKNAMDEIGQALYAGKTDATTLQKIANKWCIGSDGQVDGKAYKKLYNLFKTEQTKEAKCTTEDKNAMVQQLMNGRFSGITELKEFGIRASLESNNPKWNETVQDIIEDFNNGKGAFKYDFDGIKSILMDNYKGPDKEARWHGIQLALIQWVNEQRKWQNKEPEQKDVIDYAQKYINKGIVVKSGLIGSTQFSAAELFGKYAITDYKDLGDGNYAVKLPGDDRTFYFTGEDMKDLRGGVSAKEIVSRHIKYRDSRDRY